MLALNSSSCGSETAEACVSAVYAETGGQRSRLVELQTAARSSLERGEPEEARRLINEASRLDRGVTLAEDWAELRDETKWPDGWLVAAVRCDPPDEAALDALVKRYWNRLCAHCQ